MENKCFNIFKIEYDWCEGEHEETLLCKNAKREEFEKDLVEARDFARSLLGKKVKENYLGKGYSVECLPEYYGQIIWFLKNKKGYGECYFDEEIYYGVDDNLDKKDVGIRLIKFQNMINDSELG